ncbi:hypothetical protein J3B02_005799, partial [Coemansia erecta]
LGYLTPISSDYRWVQASSLSMRSSGSDSFFDSGKKQYIDLWPIQIGTAATTVDGNGQHAAYLTNFDSYVMVLQLGTVLHLVPYWNKHYTLRVMCFVEDQADVAEEYRRVDKLLRDLRVMAELRVFYLRGAGLSSYDEAASQISRKALPVQDMESAIRPTEQLPPNSVRFASQRKCNSRGGPLLVSTSLDRASALEDVATSGIFSRKVNLPMPLRYESSRIERSGPGNNSTIISSSSSSTSSSSVGDTSDSESENESDVLPRSPNRLSLLPRFATISSGTSSLGRRLRGQAGRWSGRDRRSSADSPKPNRVRILSNPKAQDNENLAGSMGMASRRRSDGSMVLSDFYSRALASVPSSSIRPPKSNDQMAEEEQAAESSDSASNSNNGSDVPPAVNVAAVAATVSDSEFNDMSV